ncbi:hypothetical protein KX928_18475 [Roseobacter sp. YSTF-M11]|uniref:Uncharacterized protein n=1 Tax=Roseobacter insulae TaxID=2859783 RepID=A0A9X1FZH5_9RHOB|nr:hypothetical protein [Roseobacter insulae]MBW4709778.1 hypothetical protein [Roseobacter insulae]
MAIISTLIGGVGGFFTFASAMLVFKTSFLTALSLYFLVGLSIAATIMALAFACRGVLRLTSRPASLIAQPAHAPSARRSLHH